MELIFSETVKNGINIFETFGDFLFWLCTSENNFSIDEN